MSSALFTPTRLDRWSLKNRIVMALLKRSRAIGNLSNALLPVNDSNELPIHFVTGHSPGEPSLTSDESVH